MTTENVKSLAFYYGHANNITLSENWHENKHAFKDGLISLNPTLTIRTSENNSLSRLPSVSENFENLSTVYDKNNCSCQDIGNIDETGVTTHCSTTHQSNRRRGCETSETTFGERVSLVTVVFAVNACSNSVPPVLIFPRKYFKQHFVVERPPGCIDTANRSAWVTNKEFLNFKKRFVNYVLRSSSPCSFGQSYV